MDYRSLTKLLIKIAGLFVALHALGTAGQSTPVAIEIFQKNDDALVAVLLGALPVLIPLILGAVLFFFPGVVANHMLSSDSNAAAGEVKSVARIEEAALAILAIYILVQSVADAVYWLSRMKLYHLFVEQDNFGILAPALLPEEFSQLMATGAQLLIALCLFWGARGLVRLRAQIRGDIIEPQLADKASDQI